MFYNIIGGDMMCKHDKLIKTKLVEYCKTKEIKLLYIISFQLFAYPIFFSL